MAWARVEGDMDWSESNLLFNSCNSLFSMQSVSLVTEIMAAFGDCDGHSDGPHSLSVPSLKKDSLHQFRECHQQIVFNLSSSWVVSLAKSHLLPAHTLRGWSVFSDRLSKKYKVLYSYEFA